MESVKRTSLMRWLGIQLAQLGLLCLLFALFFGLGTVFFWHANDAWPQWSALDVGWPPPAIEQPRLHQVVAAVYHLPLGAVAGGAGVLLTLIGVALSRR